MKKRTMFVVFVVVVASMLLLSACARQESCQTAECPNTDTTNTTDSSINNSNTVIVNVDANGQGSAANGENTSTEAAAEASIFVAPSWDDTCVEQSKLIGVILTPLAEGDFFACVYNGSPADVTIPTGMLADVDLGQVYVAKGPVTINGVPNLTLRPAHNGTDAEACNQVNALTVYGQSLPEGEKFEAQPYNFVCP